MPLSGVRSSCDMLARSSDFIRLADSARSIAARSSALMRCLRRISVITARQNAAATRVNSAPAARYPARRVSNSSNAAS